MPWKTQLLKAVLVHGSVLAYTQEGSGWLFNFSPWTYACSLWILCQSGCLKHPMDLTPGYDTLDQNLQQKFNITI